MTPESPPPLRVCDLIIYVEAGEVRNSLGMSVRLGPVNMRILGLLASRAGEVVLRNELFEEIWPNQLVSDDALTRCISDIRSELGKLSENSKYIETIPKRGYRWNADVRESGQDRHPMIQGTGGHRATILEQVPPSSRYTHSVAWIGRGLLYAATLLVIASLSTWLLDRFSRPGPPIVVVMPTQADPSQSDLAVRIEQQISDYLVSLDQVDLLSRTAVQSRPTNPFPYFYHEFGARWLIESELRTISEKFMVTIVLVDARAGIVLVQTADQFPNGEGPSSLDVEHLFEPLTEFVNSQPGH